MTAALNSPELCPLCGRSNLCGNLAGATRCWCFGADIAQEVLDRIPEEARGVACLCADCASGRVPSPCTDVCDVDPPTQTCAGCMRTLDEIANWGTMTDPERRAVLARLAELRRSS